MAATTPFVWSGNRAISATEAERNRKTAEALAARYPRPQNMWEGLASLTGDVGGALLNWQADQAEEKGRSEVAKALEAAQNGGNPMDYITVLGNEWASPSQSAVASALLNREWGQQDQEAQWAREDARAAMPETQPLINAGGGSIYDPNSNEWITNPNAAVESPANFDDISGIRKEVQSLPSYKNLAQATPIYNAMVETAGRDSRASDLNMVYGLGKIMDPTSVVREGEMFMVQGVNTLPDKVVEGINSLLTGTSSLSPETRKAIMTEAYGRVKGYEDAFGQDANSYRGLAERYKINPDDILPGFEQLSPFQAPGDAPAITPDAQGDALYDSLPSGTEFIDPEGNRRRKP